MTGGGRGLGFEIARRRVARGHVVHVTDVHPELAARDAAELGPRAFGSALDVRSFPACRAAASRSVRRAGSLEVWVNYAGVLVTGPAWEQDERTRAQIPIPRWRGATGRVFDLMPRLSVRYGHRPLGHGRRPRRHLSRGAGG